MSVVEAARHLVTLEGWEWADHLRVVHPDGRAWRLCGDNTVYSETAGAAADPSTHPLADADVAHLSPDLDDFATRGVVLGMLSRRVGAYCWIRPAIGGWSCLRDERVELFGHIASGPSWAEAFVAAWEATP